jgi:hypothetical protein
MGISPGIYFYSPAEDRWFAHIRLNIRDDPALVVLFTMDRGYGSISGLNIAGKAHLL